MGGAEEGRGGVCLEKELAKREKDLFEENGTHKSAVSWNSDQGRLELGGGVTISIKCYKTREAREAVAAEGCEHPGQAQLSWPC